MNAVSATFRREVSALPEIFDLVAEGYTSHAISIRLAISSRTVESLRVQIMEKMRAESIAILVRQSIRLGRLKP